MKQAYVAAFFKYHLKSSPESISSCQEIACDDRYDNVDTHTDPYMDEWERETFYLIFKNTLYTMAPFLDQFRSLYILILGCKIYPHNI